MAVNCTMRFIWAPADSLKASEFQPSRRRSSARRCWSSFARPECVCRRGSSLATATDIVGCDIESSRESTVCIFAGSPFAGCQIPWPRRISSNSNIPTSVAPPTTNGNTRKRRKNPFCSRPRAFIYLTDFEVAKDERRLISRRQIALLVSLKTARHPNTGSDRRRTVWLTHRIARQRLIPAST